MHSAVCDSRRGSEVSGRTCHALRRPLCIREIALLKPHFAHMCCFYLHHKGSANTRVFQSILMFTSHRLKNTSILLFYYHLRTSLVCFSSLSSRLFVNLVFFVCLFVGMLHPLLQERESDVFFYFCLVWFSNSFFIYTGMYIFN